VVRSWSRWLVAGTSGALIGYWTTGAAYRQVRWNHSLMGMNIPWQKAHGAGLVTGILVGLLVFWMVLWIAARREEMANANSDAPLPTGSTELGYPRTRADTAVIGILAVS
jgi:hypothetical protein